MSEVQISDQHYDEQDVYSEDSATEEEFEVVQKGKGQRRVHVEAPSPSKKMGRKPVEKTACSFIISRGVRKGQPCGKSCNAQVGFCSSHKDKGSIGAQSYSNAGGVQVFHVPAEGTRRYPNAEGKVAPSKKTKAGKSRRKPVAPVDDDSQSEDEDEDVQDVTQKMGKLEMAIQEREAKRAAKT